MRKQLTRTILVAGTAAAALFLAIPAAMATGTWTVTGGPNFTSAQASGASFKLADGFNSFTCSTAGATGTVVDQNMNPNTSIGSITASNFGSSAHLCSGSFSSTGFSAQKSGTTTTLVAGSFSSGTTTGTVTGVDQILTVNSVFISGGHCSTEVTGTAGVSYNNTTHELNFTTTGDNLTVVGTGCNGVINKGDHPTFSSSGGGEVVTGTNNMGGSSPISVSQP